MTRKKPPFRADHVGSLLRPKHVLDARKQCEAKRITPDDLRRIEDDEIKRLVTRQEDIGLQCVTDGELRRGSWHMDFLCKIGGVQIARHAAPAVPRRQGRRSRTSYQCQGGRAAASRPADLRRTTLRS